MTLFFTRFQHLPILFASVFFLVSSPLLAFNAGLEQDTYGLGMGSAVAAIAGGTHAIQWNPAGIARATVPMAQLGLGFDPKTNDLQFNTSVLYPFPDGTVFALSQFSDFPSTPGSTTTYMGSVAMPLSASRDFLFGVNLKYLALSSRLGSGLESGRGLGIDFGLSYDLRRPQGTIASFALAVKDAGSQIRFDNTDEQPVTRTFVLAAAYQNIPDTRVEMDYDIIDQTLQNSSLHNRLRLGAERFFGERFYSVRAGFDDLFNNDGYFSMGAGYHPAQPFEISYAFRASTSRSEVSHFLSFVYRFDNVGKAEPAPEKVSESSSSEITIGSGSELTEEPSSAGKPISTVPLRKMDIQVDPAIFSPSGRQKTATFTFPEGKTTDISRWILEIQSSGQKTVRRIGGTGPLLPMLAWDGMNEEGKQVPDGKYNVVLKTFGRKNDLLSNDRETVEVLSSRSHFDLQADRAYFSTKPAKKGKVEVNFTVNSGGSPDVQIWNFQVSDTSTSKIVYEAKGKLKLPKTIKWNGRNTGKTFVADGTYTCLLTAQDLAGNALKTEPVQVTADSAPPDLTVKGEDNLVDFDVKKNFRFALQAADRSGIENWKLEVSNENDEVIKHFAGTGLPPKELTWDGLLDDGKSVEPGSLLEAQLSAADRAGNASKADPFTLQVDYQPPASGEQMTLNLTTVYFDSLSSTLTIGAKKEIEKAASSIRPYLNKSILVLKGYTSPEETGDLLVLSHDRAFEVKKFLMKSLKISEDEIFVVGYSSREPLKSPSSPMAGDTKRRVIISLTTKP